ncbi:MAG: hypothetical protein ABJA11_10755 [Pseudolysinimonas sp.]
MFRIATVATVTAVASVVTLGSLVCAVPAFAATPADGSPAISAHSTLAEIQQAGAAATAKRITSLTTRIGKVSGGTHLTSADKATVLATLNHDLSGMQGLKSKIAADTTVASARADYGSIFTSYRVYAVGLQQSFVASAADGLTGTAIPKLQSASAKITAAFAAHPSKVTPALQAQLTDMKAKIADAVTKTSGLSASALAVTPSAYNANHAVLTADRAAARAALADRKAAVQDGKAIRTALKALK